MRSEYEQRDKIDELKAQLTEDARNRALTRHKTGILPEFGRRGETLNTLHPHHLFFNRLLFLGIAVHRHADFHRRPIYV